MAQQQAAPDMAAASPDQAAGSGRVVPWALLAGIAVAALAIVLAARPILDIDLYWHLIVGDDIRSGVPVTEAGRGWSFAPVPDTWVSTQWLAEVVLSWLYSVGGWPALALYRVVTATAALGVVGLVTLRGRSVRAGVVPFALAAIALGSTTQERSQQLTYVLAPLVGWWAERLWRHGRLPRWWVVLPLTVVWANYHGGWILLPMMLVAAALARVVERGVRDRVSWQALLLAVGCGLAAMVSPVGPANAFSALTFSRAASSQIAEWERVALWSDQGWQLGAALLLALLCWVFGRSRPRRGEVLLVVLLVAFGFLAYRNITPTALMLAPLLAGTMARALPEPAPTPRDHAPLVTVAWCVAAIGVAVAVAVAFLPDRAWHQDRPVALAQRIAEHPGPLRVLNTYNASGPLLWFGGGPEHVQVAIDGRTDRYGAAYIDRYLDTLLAARPGWSSELSRLDPDIALLYSNEALTGALVERGWRTVERSGPFSLLVPPGAVGW